MYINPFFFLTASFAPPKELYPAWVTCACVFIAFGAVAVRLTLRNLQRAGVTCKARREIAYPNRA
jgi:hypothetical protein